jgi:hypothetical protein
MLSWVPKLWVGVGADSADMCAWKFPLIQIGGRASGQAWADGEGGPPLDGAEIFKFIHYNDDLVEILKTLCFEQF